MRRQALLLILIGLCLAKILFPRSLLAEDKFFEIKAKKFSYSPNIIKVNKGDRLKLRLISEDVHHGFFLDGYGVQTQAYPGQDGSISFVAKRSGRFSFRCSVTCGEFHPYMVGYLIVGPNLRFLGFAFLTLFIGGLSFSIMLFKKGSFAKCLPVADRNESKRKNQKGC